MEKLYCINYFKCKKKHLIIEKYKKIYGEYPKYVTDLIHNACSSIDWEEDYIIYCIACDKSFRGTITEFQVLMYESINEK